jgi:hypothetical protein
MQQDMSGDILQAMSAREDIWGQADARETGS